MSANIDSRQEQYFDLEDLRLGLWQALVHESNAGFSNAESFKLESFQKTLRNLYPIERYWTYPGLPTLYQAESYANTGSFSLLQQLLTNVFQSLKGKTYRRQKFTPYQTNLETLNQPTFKDTQQLQPEIEKGEYKPYFEVLVIHPNLEEYEVFYRNTLASLRNYQDEFLYDLVFVDNANDAINCILANTDIQACVYVPGFNGWLAESHDSDYCNALKMANDVSGELDESLLSQCLQSLRPELDHYLLSSLSPYQVAPDTQNWFRRIVYDANPLNILHHEIIQGVRERYLTPFFNALQLYSKSTKSVFHALPLSRGMSAKDSPWIDDIIDFYGKNIFLAETSSTQGGLDSLLAPKGAIKQAQEKAAKSFGSQHSYYVTNGTSTSNKIVMQSNLGPGDIVLISADCHKSIPYSVTLAGAYPIFLQTYPLEAYDLYGAVSLQQIKDTLFSLKASGLLEKVKQITLTNSTFDGLIYDVEHFMLEVLAIKDDIIFHWDEAWFAYAHFNPLYFKRTAMSSARAIKKKLKSEAYAKFYQDWLIQYKKLGEAEQKTTRLYPKPGEIQLKVYATQSTHKTLTSFRQASMIHVYDDQFDDERFLEAYRIHSTTSPNYQIIASLDFSRRQMALEGYGKIRQAHYYAWRLRNEINQSPQLKHYFEVLNDSELVPDKHRVRLSQNASSIAPLSSHTALTKARWQNAEFVVDPSRITLDISRTGLDGASFRELLINKYDIQVNKTSLKTVLFIIHIGTTESSIKYLLQVLHEISDKLKQENKQLAPQKSNANNLPQNRQFHKKFSPFTKRSSLPISDLRFAYFAGNETKNVKYVELSEKTFSEATRGTIYVSASFVTPYPPGFPVLVPGQLIDIDILDFFKQTTIKEIHGFQADKGFKVFTQEFLNEDSKQ